MIKKISFWIFQQKVGEDFLGKRNTSSKFITDMKVVDFFIIIVSGLSEEDPSANP
jgi:hypothetical protein